MPKISFEKIVKAKRAKVFEIVTDYESFQKTLPQYFPSIRIRSTRGNVSVVEEHLKIDERELVMMTKHVITPPRLHEVFVIGGDAKGSYISELYEEIPSGTKITVSADLKLKGIMKIAGVFAKNKIRSHFREVMDEFAKIAED